MIPLPQFPSHRTCTLCPLHATPGLHNPGIPTIHLPDSLPPGPSPALVVIGQNPGYSEDLANAPFVGASGVLVRGKNRAPGVYLDGHSFRTRASIYLTNAARCATFGELEPENAHYIACSPHLFADLTTIAALHPAPAPLFILLLGAAATGHFFKGAGHKKRSLNDALAKNGAPLTLANREWRVFATWHPAYILRNRKMIYSVADHLALLSDALSGVTPTPSAPRIESPRVPRKPQGVPHATAPVPPPQVQGPHHQAHPPAVRP